MPRNNFDVCRLMLALIVAAYHAAFLTKAPQLGFFFWLFNHVWPVHCFFVISGYLVLASWERRGCWRSYAGARAGRIYPAYALVVIVCGLALIPAGQRLHYLLPNLAFLNFLAPAVPGVFSQNPVPFINGALWSIKVEVQFYLIVPVMAALCRRYPPWLVLTGGYSAAIVYRFSLLALAQQWQIGAFEELSRQLPGQFGFFAIGAMVYYYPEAFRRALLPVAVTCAGLLGLGFPTFLFMPILIGALTMAFCLGPYLGAWRKYGDFSYGLYLYHYPIIQCLIAAGYAADSPWLFIVTAFALAFIAAILSWHLVEKRFLARARRPGLSGAGGAAEAMAGVP